MLTLKAILNELYPGTSMRCVGIPYLKKKFRLENYLIEIENTKHALALARFRISSHNLRIETGPYDQRKTKPEERLCINCRSQAVDDEQHFLLQCPLYNNERHLLLETVNATIPLFHSLPENERFSVVMQSKTPKLMKALGNYIFTCLKKRGISTAANQNPP